MARQKIPVVCVIGNDAAWTQIRRGQVDIYGEERAVATGLAYTRYEKGAEALGCFGADLDTAGALGCFGACVDTTAALGPALEAAFAASERDEVPAVVNVKIASSEFRKG